MTTLTRAAFLSAIAGAALIAGAPEAHAARDNGAEQYVQTNATEALRTLGNRQLTSSARTQTFNTLMARFADMPRIASYVLGRYSTQLRTDATLRADWQRTFQDYAIAVYEDRLERYSESTIRVTNSIERTPGRDVVVISEMTPRGQGRALPVQWRLIKSGDVWKVVDVSLVIEGNEIWLAQQQQRDFLAELDRNNGDIRALMRSVRDMTTSMRARIVARG